MPSRTRCNGPGASNAHHPTWMYYDAVLTCWGGAMRYFVIWLVGAVLLALIPLGSPSSLEALVTRYVAAVVALGLILYFVSRKGAKTPRGRGETQG